MKLGDTMQRSLTLILNGRENNRMQSQDTIYLNLETMEAKELDSYVSKNFNSSEEVRKKYASKINPFLEQHKGLIERVESETGRKFNGSIVVTELDDNLVLERKKVIYKKDATLFKLICKNRKFLIELEKRDYINYRKAVDNNKPYMRIFSDYYGRELRFYCFEDKKFERTANEWRNSIKEYSYYYEIIRQVLKEYEGRYKELRLDSLDVLYSKYTRETIERKEELKEQREFLKNSKLLFEQEQNKIAIPRFKNYADEDGYPGDLEPLNTDAFVEETGLSHGKTKTLNNGHHQLYDYEN